MATDDATEVFQSIRDVDHLDRLLSASSEGVVSTCARLGGDLIILGVAGKMGPTLAWMARRAFDASGQPERRVIGVARFTSPGSEAWLNARGIETIRADLHDPDALAALPDVPNVISMFAMKFGATGRTSETWATNTLLPARVALRFRTSRVVAFSTGNVYGLTPAERGGSRESDDLEPIGEYAMSCVGRERILEHLSRSLSIPLGIIRLNYAVEMRYGVLVDLARKVMAGKPIDLGMGYVNVIWQADANAIALRSFDHVASPPFVVNVTGPETLAIRDVALALGCGLGLPVAFQGEERDDALLSNAALSRQLFGPPRLSAERLIELTADWLKRGGPTLDKPTRFEARDGRF